MEVDTFFQSGPPDKGANYNYSNGVQDQGVIENDETEGNAILLHDSHKGDQKGDYQRHSQDIAGCYGHE